MVFNQEHQTDNPKVLNYTGDLSDPLVKRMVERLARAVSDPQVRREMDAEQEVERAFARIEAEHLAKLREIESQYQATLQEKNAALEEKNRVISELMKQLADKQK